MTIEKVVNLKVSRDKLSIWLRTLKNWRLPTQLIIFPDYWAKILKIAHPVNYTYLPSWLDMCMAQQLEARKKNAEAP